MSDRALAELQATIASTSALVSHLSSSLDVSPTATGVPSSTSGGAAAVPNALALSSTAASLVKAQTTKLSLLVINKPFTPSAIGKIIKTLGSECLPALVTGAQLALSSPRYPQAVRGLLTQHTAAVLREFSGLLSEIPTDERGISAAQGQGHGRDPLASTGVVWAACDALVDAGAKGAAETAAGRAELTHGLVRDAVEELKEWLEQDEDEDEGGHHSDDDGDGDDKHAFADLLAGGGTCPPGLRKLASRTVRMTEHVRLLFPPLIKRRIRKFPPLTAKTKAAELPAEAEVARLDELLERLRVLSEEIDEAAGQLYEGDEEGAEEQLAKLADLATRCADAADKNWAGEEDELSTWLKDKWKPAMEELAKSAEA